MKYNDFYLRLKHKKLFTLEDLKILDLSYLNVQLSRWEKKGLITKISRGIYTFSEFKNTLSHQLIANKLYQPSYLSLEFALQYYGIIPEIPFTLTSITSKTTRKFSNQFGEFTYRHIASKYFWGYQTVQIENVPVFIADKEKALLDYFYFHSEFTELEDLQELRLNFTLLKEELDWEKIHFYLDIYNKKYLFKIFEILSNFLKNA